MKRAQRATLANADLRKASADRAVLAAMGLGDIVAEVDDRPPAPKRARSKPRRAPTPAQVAHLRSLARAYPPPRPPAGRRKMDHLLRLMAPGKCYVMADLRRACPQLSRGSVHGFVGVKFIRYGYLERVAAPPGMAHRGPLDHGSPQQSPIRWLYRLTERGVAEAQAVAEADWAARTGGGPGEDA